jgi:hypothetical protein
MSAGQIDFTAPAIWCWDCDRQVPPGERYGRGVGPLAHERHTVCQMPLMVRPRPEGWTPSTTPWPRFEA